MSDSHAKVHESGQAALKQFGSVTKNPEIHILVPVLMQALVDPNSKTTFALSRILETPFEHYIDVAFRTAIASESNEEMAVFACRLLDHEIGAPAE